jgi:hypothetical protein
MADIDNNEYKMKTTYNNELNQLSADRDNKLLEISQWLANAQNQLRSNKAEYSAEKSQQLMNYAINLASQYQGEFTNKRSLLDSWVANKATSIEQARKQMAENASYSPILPAFQGINATPSVSSTNTNTGLFGYGSGGNDESLYKNFIV